MRVFDSVINLFYELFKLATDLIMTILGYGHDFILFLYEKFLEIPLTEKIIVINSIPAFFAVVLPVARYYIFEEWYYINNPLSVYMIGIVFFMVAGTLFRYFWVLVLRVLVNMYYLFWVIYLPMAGELTKADPYDITFGYYMNIAVPAVYILVAAVSFVIYRE